MSVPSTDDIIISQSYFEFLNKAPSVDVSFHLHQPIKRFKCDSHQLHIFPKLKRLDVCQILPIVSPGMIYWFKMSSITTFLSLYELIGLCNSYTTGCLPVWEIIHELYRVDYFAYRRTNMVLLFHTTYISVDLA